MTGSTGGQLTTPVWWLPDSRNPILPPTGKEGPDATRCMNPWVVRNGDEYRLYYSGGNQQGFQDICLATSQNGGRDPWERKGVVLSHGNQGDFDYQWAVLPHVIASREGYRLYYTGNRGSGEGLSTFAGIGLAYSEDGIHFERHTNNPVIAPSDDPAAPDYIGVAGGSIVDVGELLRFYYTGFRMTGDDPFLNQQKAVCYAESVDGIEWEKKGAILFRNPDRDYMDVAAAGPVVWRSERGLYRMLLSAIGTRWGYYSICYAESDDGITWRTGDKYGDDLALGPHGDGWERQMVEYPTVVPEEIGGRKRMRLFYCGNGYGATGIGTAMSAPLRATGVAGEPALRITSEDTAASLLKIPDELTVGPGEDVSLTHQSVAWKGPTADGMIWYESTFGDGSMLDLRVRVIIRHDEAGLVGKLTVMNETDELAVGVRASVSIDSSRGSHPMKIDIGDVGARGYESVPFIVAPTDTGCELELQSSSGT